MYMVTIRNIWAIRNYTSCRYRDVEYSISLRNPFNTKSCGILFPHNAQFRNQIVLQLHTGHGNNIIAEYTIFQMIWKLLKVFARVSVDEYRRYIPHYIIPCRKLTQRLEAARFVFRTAWSLSSAVDVPVNFQSDAATQTANLVALRLHEILRSDVLRDIEMGPWCHRGREWSNEALLWMYSISQEICTRFCCALLCCGYAIVHSEFTWNIYPYSSGLLCWHWGNR